MKEKGITIDKSRMTLKELQSQEFEILQEFQKFCDRFHLQYYLTAGTLLGAVRHQGFIPWDDDIDVCMPRADYNKLQKLAAELPNGYFLQSFQTEKNFPYYFSKMRKDGTNVEEPLLGKIQMHQGIYIDIFPLDKCPDHDRTALIFFKVMALLSVAVLSRGVQNFTCGYEKKIMRVLWQVLRMFPNKMLFLFREGIRVLFGFFASGDRLCTVGGAHGFPFETYRAEWFHNAVSMQFETKNFPAPEGWHEILENMYHDYMSFPKSSERKGHFEE